MFQVCLSALITKMCWVRVLPMKRFCVPSSRKVSVPKSTHYANWIRLFSLFPQRLHHHLEIKAWCCNLCRSLRRSLAAGWRVSSQGRCSWESLLCVSFQQTTVFAHMYLFQLHICYGVHRYAPCLFVCFFTILNVLFLHLHVFKCECFGNSFACGCLCMCHMRVCVWKQQAQELKEWQRVCGGQKLKPSDLVSESPASQLSLCLWHPARPLTPSCSLWRQLPRKLKAVFKQRQEKREEHRHCKNG